MRTIVIAEEVRARVSGLFVESVNTDHLTVAREAPWLDAAAGEIVAQWNGRTLDDVPEIRAYRELNRRFSTPFGAAVPAVENLLARSVTKGKFPRINSLCSPGGPPA